MLKAVLFDMDGVLYDSMKNHTESWYRTCCEYGFEATRDEFYLYEGQTGSQTINDLFVAQRGRQATDAEIKEIYHYKTTSFESLPKAPAMPGAAEVLDAVGKAGLVRVLVTGSGQATLIQKLEHNYPGIFSPDHMVTGIDTPKGLGKPNPYPYLKGLEKGGMLQPQEAIVVENAPLGVRAAHAAGIFTIAVNTGPLNPQVLKDEGADVVLASMSELAEKFQAILEENGFKMP